MRAVHLPLRRLAGLLLLGLTVASLAVAAADPSLLTLNHKNADLRDVLNALAAQAGVSISMDETVSGVVSIHFENVTFEECLQRLAAMFRLYITKEGRFYYVTRQLIRVTKDQGGLVSVEIQAAKLPAVLAEVTRVAGTNLTLLGTPPAETINLVLQRVPLADLVSFLAESAHCQVEQKNGVYIFRPAGTAGQLAVKFENGRLSVDATGVPLSVLVRALSDKTGTAVLCEQSSATVQVNAFFAPLPLEEGLNAIAAANGLRLYKEGAYYRFGRGESMGLVRVRDGHLTIDVKNADILEVLAEISRQGRVTIIPTREVTGRVSGTITEADFEQGFSAFLQANGFVLERDGTIYNVKRLSTGQSIIISLNQDGTLDLDVNNAPLAAACSELAKKKSFGVVIYANVNWNVTSVHLNKVQFEEALDRLMAGTTYTYRREGDTYLIGEGVNFRQGDTDFLQSELITLHFVQAEAIWNTIPAAFPRQNIILIKESNSLLITGTPKLIAAFKAFLAKLDLPQDAVRTEIIPLKHMKAEDAIKLLPPSMPKGDLIVLKEVNSIAVTGSEGFRNQVREYLAKIDVMAPMILFDVLVLQISENESRGGTLESFKVEVDGQSINWSDLGGLVGSIISPNTPAATKLSATIKAAVSDGRAKIRANPKIATLSGTPAHFDVVTRYNYSWPMPTTTTSGGTTTTTTEYKNFTVDSGIQLTLTPWVSASKEITLQLEPKISQYTTSPTEGVGSSVTALPGVMERSTQSAVRIMDGYTVVISGFIQESEEITRTKVPILGSIPILGQLFQSTKKTKRQDEFVIIITPTLIEDPAEINKLVGEVSGPGTTPAPIVIDMSEEKKKKETDPTP